LGDVLGVMKRMQQVNLKISSCAAFVCCAALLFYFPAQVFSQEDGTSLMLEMSPPEGGYLNVIPGVHVYDMYAEVALKATPKPGYQFVCWLGSVNESVMSSTSVFLDSPKMVIAVFERTKFEMAGIEESADTGNGGGGGLVRSGGLSDTTLNNSVSGTHTEEFDNNFPRIPDDVPVPPGEEVPEPATITLLFTGFFILAKRRKRV
jgi:hypothetical protein